MTIQTTDTAVLTRTINHMDAPAMFLLNRYFPGVQRSTSAHIFFDIRESRPRLAPFVHPKREGKVVQGLGSRTESFKPAYVKDKRYFDPEDAQIRTPGEQLTGSLDPDARERLWIASQLVDQREMLARREEVMAAEALRTGQVTVTGEDYPTVVVDFKRAAALTKVLAGAARWGEVGVSIVDNIEEWALEIQTTSGAVVDEVVMDPEAWKIARKDPEVKELLDTRRGSESSAETGPLTGGQGEKKAKRVGRIGNFDVWTYKDIYEDEDGVLQDVMPANQVIMSAPGGSAGLDGTKAYGMIFDRKANYRADRFFAKTWEDEDPSLLWLMAQSAPLVIPYRPNASLAATVR